MKTFLMRGVVLSMLLSLLVVPASANFSNTDSTNISNIKSYTYDIKTAVTSGSLATNVSNIKTSLSNISSSVSSIYTQVQGIKSNIETTNTRIGSSNQTGYTSIISSLISLAGKFDTSNSRLLDIKNDLAVTNTRLNSVNTNLGYIDTNTSTTASNTTSMKADSTNILSKVTSIANSPVLSSSFSGISTAANQELSIEKQNNIISQLGILDQLAQQYTLTSVQINTARTEQAIKALTSSSTYKFYFPGDTEPSFIKDSGALSTLSAMFTQDFYESLGLDSLGQVVPMKSKTIMGHLKNLSDTLASDEDKAIRESQNENVGQVKQDFVSGSSGGTSLGKSDFGDLSIAGSTAKDLASLNGQASINKFTDGITDANTSGLGWFSADTKSALDSVSSSQGTESRALARDSDPYNMAGFSDNYNWLFGGD